MNFLLIALCILFWGLAFRVLKGIVVFAIVAWLIVFAAKEHPDLVRDFWQIAGALAHKVGEWAREYKH